MDQTNKFLSLKNDEIRKILLENERQLKKDDLLMRKISSLERADTKNLAEISHLQNEIHTAGKERDANKKAIDNMKRDNDNLQRSVGRLNVEIEKRDGK